MAAEVYPRGRETAGAIFREVFWPVGSARVRELVAFARHRHDQGWLLGVELDLATQPAYEHVDASIKGSARRPANASSRWERLRTSALDDGQTLAAAQIGCT